MLCSQSMVQIIFVFSKPSYSGKKAGVFWEQPCACKKKKKKIYRKQNFARDKPTLNNLSGRRKWTAPNPWDRVRLAIGLAAFELSPPLFSLCPSLTHILFLSASCPYSLIPRPRKSIIQLRASVSCKPNRLTLPNQTRQWLLPTYSILHHRERL